MTASSVALRYFDTPLPRPAEREKIGYIGRLDRFLMRRYGEVEGQKIYSFLAADETLKRLYDRAYSFPFSAHRQLFERPEYLNHPELLRSPALLQYPDLALDPIRLQEAHRQLEATPGIRLPEPTASRSEMNWASLYAYSFFDELREQVGEPAARRSYAFVSRELPGLFQALTSESEAHDYLHGLRVAGVFKNPKLLECPALQEEVSLVLDPKKFAARCHLP